MGLVEIIFRIKHEWPLGEIFQQEPSAVGSLWCNNGERDVIEIRVDDPSKLKTIRDNLTSLQQYVSHHHSERDGSLIAINSCACYGTGTVAAVVAKDNCLLMPPTVFHEGWEHYKVVSMSAESERKMFRDLERLGNLDILSKTRILNTGIGGTMRISTLSLFSRLTDKQLRSLLTAYELGYYRIPRVMTTQQLAEASHLTRPTYEEHLRKAENKLISAVSQHLNLLYHQRPRDHRASHSSAHVVPN